MNKKTTISLLILTIIALLIVGSAAFASDISGAIFSGIIRITNVSSANSTVSANMTLNTQGMISAGQINSTCNNTAVRTNTGIDTAYMPSVNNSYPWCIWVPSINDYEILNYVLYTGGPAMDGKIRYFPGSAGMAVADNETIELSDNWTIDFSAYTNTDNSTIIIVSENTTALGGYYVYKKGAIHIQNTNSDNITSQYYGTWASPTGTQDPNGAWTNDANAIDNNTATYAEMNVAAKNWSKFLLGTFTQTTTGGVSVYADVGSITNELIDIDLFNCITNTWDGVYSGLGSGLTWDYFALPENISSNATRVRLYNADVGLHTATINEIKIAPIASVSIAATATDHDVTTQKNGVFFSIAKDTSGNVTPVSDNVILNAPLPQVECLQSPFTTIDINALTSTVFGSVWSQDGYTFDGADDYITIAHDASQLLTTGGGIVWWIKPDTAGEGNQGRIVDKSTGLSGNNGFRLFTGVDNVQFSINAGTTRASASGSVVPGSGNWYCVAATWDAAGTATLYVNGAVSGTPGATGAPAGITTTANVTLGGRSGATDRSYDGLLGGGTIYSVQPSATEILRYYNATKLFYTGTGNGTTVSTLSDVANNANAWAFFQSAATPYAESLSISKNGTIVAEWDPLWEYATTFTDTVNSIVATPTFPTTGSDPDITAALVSFSPIESAEATDWTLTIENPMITANATAPSRTYGGLNQDALFLAPLFTIIVGESDHMPGTFWYPIAILIVCGAGFLIFYASKSILAQSLAMGFVMYILSFTIIPWWCCVMFTIYALAINLGNKEYGGL